ncbi:MAG: ATP-binding cassette domain-containing protein [Lachnospiraceae bacterium]|nr:ATP-binding cassette domain-containing protein [Lachnospiraceae bacterium]
MSLFVNIKKEYEDFELDVSFESNKKRIGILGASGCGKSMTLKSIAGLVKPDRGRIVFDDRIFFDTVKRINIKPGKRDVGYMFQDHALFPNMTVEGNINAALKVNEKKKPEAGKVNSKDSKRALDSIIDDFELREVRRHYPAELSQGQKQRCALARMFATDPKMVLLDEPFSSMDAFLKEGLRLELMRFLDEYDKTVILVSHDRDEIYQMCDHLILMDKGRIIDSGSTRELFIHPKSKTGARLTGCKNISRIERIDDHRIKALDWQGIELITAQKVGEDHRYAGIRAHDFISGKEGVNVITCKKASISRLPFEWYVTFDNGLWWKLPKELSENNSALSVPEYISVVPEKIILMK